MLCVVRWFHCNVRLFSPGIVIAGEWSMYLYSLGVAIAFSRDAA